ncbi:hypothetical protein H6G54_18975 [Anabaena cylindrica FACHB-243]|uniref:Uncharacterized protein n=1 Tax=Anabaena cylindrica (strain ATCC 27899 / PCC 7122) TaxID=272123 RepID=K9ZH56_ANACC|nr:MULTISPECIES: hypothetical protein [Anabaena]AFZ57892.1 hypothetical protein Anacy_2443 [Anabaena cylindrica PCC 7122]MBD2419752.1 hypothetical protein [Anabaena cylindrica FACHB-243]MBY5281543.1 hypothetical protein [Anabaena sp. CCAP 1446/1C]MBY5307203.1 hypothetical protein [Anabaena sp. CCAP 1446/1C]MCM2405566.1 hypothetical protein [Anabaena sp. CCAP 1446/1C]
MNLLRIRMHHLIEQLADEDLQNSWEFLQALHFDCYMLKSIEQVKPSQHPWDILTHDEAMRLLMFL